MYDVGNCTELVGHFSAKRDAVLPLHFPVKAADGSELSEIFVRKGTLVHIGILGSNQNSATWGPDAHEFKPERWMAPLPESVKNAPIPSVFSHL
jgi:cytochrome P450